MPFSWSFYRFCPSCGVPYGRGLNGFLPRHGCAERFKFRDLPRLSMGELVKYVRDEKREVQ